MNDDATSLNPGASDGAGRGAPGNAGVGRSTGQSSPAVASEVRVMPDDPHSHPLDLVEEAGSAWAVAWPGVGSHLRSMHRIRLDAGGLTRRQFHPMEAVYYVLSGELVVEDMGRSQRSRLVAGSMAFVEPMTEYRFEAGESGAELVGGPCPPDPGLYRALRGG